MAPDTPTAAWTPYCGVGPGPAELAGRWNLDPLVLGSLAALAVAYVLRWRRGAGAQDYAFAAAVAALLVAFVSPLCALSSALFSARVAHHVAVVAVAAPLLAFGLPRSLVPAAPLRATVALHAVLLWLWHAPSPYAWALSSDAGYWLMEATLLGSAFVLWAAVRRAHALPAAAALLATLVQTGLLGALITFAGRPVYAPHARTAQAWGLTPLADQQLAGVIMWAPMAGLYLVAALALVERALRPARPGAAAA